MDNSFIRFTESFQESKNLGNIAVSSFDYDMQIHLSPNEAYSCITNVKNGLSFGNLYKVYLVDCENTVLEDVTSKVYIEEFTDDRTSKQQIRFEVINLGCDYYTDLVRFRLEHNIIGGKKYWSNPFIVSNYELDETVRFRFKNYIDLDGTNYRIGAIFQSIRLKCIKQKNNFTSSGQSYTTFYGLKYSSRVIKTKMYEYVFDMVNEFIYDRLQYLFTHDVIYVETVRVTDKQTVENTDKFGDSNVAQIKVKLPVDENDIDDEAYQVKEMPKPAKQPLADYYAPDYNNNDYKTI